MIDDEKEPQFEPQDEPAETGENGTGEEEVLELTEEATEQEAAEEAAKPKGKSVQERIDEITAARRDAERDAEYWRSRALQQPPAPEQAKVFEEAAPNPNDMEKYPFGTDDQQFQMDQLRYEMKAEFAAERQRFQAEQVIHTLEQGYSERVAQVKEEIPDYDDVVTRTAAQGKWPCPPVVALAAKESQVGPKILHHLATNLSEAVALSQLSPIEQAMAFGRLEARFLGSTTPQPKIATNAPEPAPARTKGGQFALSGALDDRLSTEDWMKRRNEQARQGR